MVTGPGRRTLLLALPSAQRGGAELMALAAAQRLSRRHELLIAVADGPLRAELAACGRLVPAAPMLPLWGAGPRRWTMSAARTLHDARRLAALLERHGCAAVLCSSATLLAPVLAARRAGIPALVHVRDWPGSRLTRPVLRIHARKASTIVAIADAQRPLLRGRGGSARLVTIPDGVRVPAADAASPQSPSSPIRASPAPVRSASAPAPPAPPAAPLRIALIGGIDPRKGQDVAVRALARLGREGVAAQLTLVGRETDPAYAEALRATIAAERLGDRVELLGQQGDPWAALGRVDVLVAPSRGEWTPLAVLEAMARGVPVIAADTGALAEVLDGGRCGALVPPGDPGALADALRSIAQADRTAARVRAAGERVRARYRQEASLDGLEAELARLLG